MEATLIANPGTTRSELAKLHAVTWHAAAHHIDDLIGEGVVRELRQGPRLHLFHVRSKADPATVALSHPRSTAVLQSLKVPSRIIEVSRALAMSRKVVASLVGQLRMHGLAELRADGRLELTPKGRRLLVATQGGK